MSDIRPYLDFYPSIKDSAYIDKSSTVIGQVEIDEDVSIWPRVVVRGDVNSIKIGARTNIQDNSILHVSRKSEKSANGYSLYIGTDVTVGHQVTLHGCTVGNRILIGMGSVVLDGVVIEDDVMIGAGSLVPPGKRLKSGFLYMGMPVREVRLLKPEEIDFLKESARHYVNLKNDYKITI